MAEFDDSTIDEGDLAFSIDLIEVGWLTVARDSDKDCADSVGGRTGETESECRGPAVDVDATDAWRACVGERLKLGLVAELFEGLGKVIGCGSFLLCAGSSWAEFSGELVEIAERGVEVEVGRRRAAGRRWLLCRLVLLTLFGGLRFGLLLLRLGGWLFLLSLV